jgi:hypothetical protein
MRTEFWSEKDYCKTGKEMGDDVKIIHRKTNRLAANILQRHDKYSGSITI